MTKKLQEDAPTNSMAGGAVANPNNQGLGGVSSAFNTKRALVGSILRRALEKKKKKGLV